MANLIRSLIENDKKELKRLDSIAKKLKHTLTKWQH